jgi:nitrogen regulatory protein P-II 1
MELLVCVINDEEKLESIIAGFLELGVTGATIIRSEGMARLVSEAMPVMSRLQALSSRSRPSNITIFSVIDNEETTAAAVSLVEGTLGDLQHPGTGIVFTVPVSRVLGLAQQLSSEDG